MKSISVHRRKSLRSVFTVSAVLVLAAGCMDATIPEYRSLTLELDGRSELHISTYPAGFPRETFSIPFLYKKLRTPDAVYFQVFVRDAERKAGPNRQIDSIRIHSFSYRRGDEAPVQLIADYDGYFWMQDQPQYKKVQGVSVPYRPAAPVQVSIDLTVNGRDYSFRESMPAGEHRILRPLWVYAFE